MMNIKEIELFYYNEYKYLPNEKVTVITLKDTQADEIEGWVKICIGSIGEHENESLSDIKDSGKEVNLSFNGNKPLRVKLRNVEVKNELISLDLQVIE